MPGRMLRYRSEIILSYPDDDIRQYLIYIGKERLQMADKIQQSGLDYHYPIIDMHNIDCQKMIDLGTKDVSNIRSFSGETVNFGPYIQMAAFM